MNVRPFPLALAASMVLATLGLLACGGGGSMQAGGVGSGGTGSYTTGPVSGLGSVIVNGVRYSLSQAQITSDDGQSLAEDDLQLGMLVEVQGSNATPNADATGLEAVAARVRSGPVLQGVVSDIQAGALTVLGQNVILHAKTVQPQAYALNSVVSVHGLVDADGRINATRIDVLPDDTIARKIVGRVLSLSDTQMVLSMGQGGNLNLSYRQLGRLPDGVAVGSALRVWFQASAGAGALPEIRQVLSDTALAADSQRALVEGLVTQASSNGQSLVQVNGRPVDLSRASGPVSLNVGDRVRVDGVLVAGVVQATSVRIETEADLDAEEITLFGTPAAVQGAAKTFVLRGSTVLYDGIADPGAAVLSAVCVKVKGQAYDAQGRLLATSVGVSDDCRH